MKKLVLLSGILLTVTATVASAGSGTNLRWNVCFGDGGILNKSFACDSNSGQQQLVGSFVSGTSIPQSFENDFVVDLASGSPTFPAWWSFSVGSCRIGSLRGNSLPGTNCLDWSSGLSILTWGYQTGLRGPNTTRIRGGGVVNRLDAADLLPAQEYLVFTLIVDNRKTVGPGSCTGCQTGVCIVFNSLECMTNLPANNRIITGPTNGTDSNYCTWQGGGSPVVGTAAGCPAATPTKNATWGVVKALYR